MGNEHSGRRPTVPDEAVELMAAIHEIVTDEDPAEIEDYALFERIFIRVGNRSQQRGDYQTAQDMQLGLRRLQVRMTRNLTIEDPYHQAQLAAQRAALQAMEKPQPVKG